MDLEKFHKDPYTKDLSYELFMFMLSLLSLINLVLWFLVPIEDLKNIFVIMGAVSGVFFLYDFLLRIFTAPSKSTYLFKNFGWADFLAAIPFPQFNLFRALRAFKVYFFVRRLGGKNVYKILRKQVANTALVSVFFVMFLVIEFGAIGVLYAERNAIDANITSANDAIWWAFVSITTVGYGDKFPVTDMGRIVGVVTLLVGVGLFGVVTGFVADKFVKSRS